MPRSPTLKLTGDKKLIRKLKRLGDRRKARKVLRQATNAAATPVVKAVRKIWRAEANDTGLSADNVTKKVIKTKAGFTAIIGIDAAAAAARPNGSAHVPSQIDHIVELGAQLPNGVTIPAVAPLRRGYAQAKPESEAKFAGKAAAAIEKEASKP